MKWWSEEEKQREEDKRAAHFPILAFRWARTTKDHPLYISRITTEWNLAVSIESGAFATH